MQLNLRIHGCEHGDHVSAVSNQPNERDRLKVVESCQRATADQRQALFRSAITRLQSPCIQYDDYSLSEHVLTVTEVSPYYEDFTGQ
ncbi:unnamed protein product [Onchocerca flexuosa]|uniref:Antibiotic biosynthesis monooxygenase n=1 Tax=Onchocerca flexuosa TaxID=387005 RepID=A0A183HKK4_9BILA|nr:unnamed protein product [Onchocerca flexuosa]